MSVIRRVYTDISEKTFYDMIHRAKIENACVEKDGKVNLGKLLSVLIETYADGDYTIVHKPSKVKVEAKTNLNGWKEEK